jgi:hypothetical protein
MQPVLSESLAFFSNSFQVSSPHSSGSFEGRLSNLETAKLGLSVLLASISIFGVVGIGMNYLLSMRRVRQITRSIIETRFASYDNQFNDKLNYTTKKFEQSLTETAHQVSTILSQTQKTTHEIESLSERSVANIRDTTHTNQRSLYKEANTLAKITKAEIKKIVRNDRKARHANKILCVLITLMFLFVVAQCFLWKAIADTHTGELARQESQMGSAAKVTLCL